MVLTTLYDSNVLKLDIDNSGMPDTLAIKEGVSLNFVLLMAYDSVAKKWKPAISDSDGKIQTNSDATVTTSINQSKVATSTSNVVVLVSNANRRQLVIQNVGNEDVYLGFSNDDATTDDFLLVSGATWIDNQYFGEVNAIMSSGVSDLRVMEYE